MRIVVLGAGNMATALSTALASQGHNIVQVYSRTLDAARTLASRLGEHVTCTHDTRDIVTDAQLYIFSISDSALPDVIAQMPSNKGLWVHTAGSMPIEVFAPHTSRYGVIYPMQTVSKERAVDWESIPIFVEAATPADTQLLEEIAHSISQQVIRCNSQQRRALHLAAVFACNFSNHMYAIAERLLKEQGLEFDMMRHLIRETEHKAEMMSPLQGQTGPAIRHDDNVMEKHLKLLQGTPEEEIYRIISNNIQLYDKHK